MAEWSARRQGFAENSRITQIPLRFSATSALACRQAGLRVEDYIKLTHYQHKLTVSLLCFLEYLSNSCSF